jgi:hypothetical protein
LVVNVNLGQPSNFYKHSKEPYEYVTFSDKPDSVMKQELIRGLKFDGQIDKRFEVDIWVNDTKVKI